jgi:uncharacterized protein (DUF2252 family)
MLGRMMPFDPALLARRQIASDRAKTASFPGLFERKLRRMSASPLAFLRGAAPLFYSLLAERPRLAEGPAGEGWLTGDMHLENFGAYRPDPLSFRSAKARRATRAVFDMNDFDDAIVGPFRFDVLRLTTSLILGGRELGADGVEVLSLCEALLDAYVEAAFGRPRPLVYSAPVEALIEQVRARSRKKLLDGRTELNGSLPRSAESHPRRGAASLRRVRPFSPRGGAAPRQGRRGRRRGASDRRHGQPRGAARRGPRPRQRWKGRRFHLRHEGTRLAVRVDPPR